MAKMPISHRWVISAADHPLRQIGQIGRVLRAFSRGCAQFDGKRSSSGRLIWRSRDLPRQETASAGNALLQCTGRAAVLCAQAEGAPRASAGRARPSARCGSIAWFSAWRPPSHAAPSAAGSSICRDAGLLRSVPPPAWPKSTPWRERNCRSDRTGAIYEKCSPSLDRGF